MCNFASFVLTKDRVFWLEDSALTELKADAAKTVDASGCTALKRKRK